MHASMYLENKENKYNSEEESKESVLVITSRLGAQGDLTYNKQYVQGMMSLCEVHALPPTSLNAVTSEALGQP
jgi:hypothetical protein